MNKVFKLFFLIVIMFGAIRQVAAVPIQIGIGDFSGSETVIDFDSLPMDYTPVTDQFNGLGVDFPSPPPNWDTQSEADWHTSLGDPTNGVIGNLSSIAFIDFLSPVNRVGFYLGSNINFTVVIETFRSGAQTGSFEFNQVHSFDDPSSIVFHGFEDIASIDRLGFSFTQGVHYMNDLRFETSGAASQVAVECKELYQRCEVIDISNSRREEARFQIPGGYRLTTQFVSAYTVPQGNQVKGYRIHRLRLEAASRRRHTFGYSHAIEPYEYGDTVFSPLTLYYRRKCLSV